jgi:hypothetical protein
MLPKLLRRIAVVCVTSVISTLAIGQSDSATISGRVTDLTGAVLVQAQVELQNADRGTTLTTTTNTAGMYVFSSVRPGVYHISVRKEGFQTVNAVSLTANVQDHIEQNFAMRVGAASESITVRADTLHVETAPSIGTTVDSNLVANIPLNGRSMQTLIMLSPGIVGTRADSRTPGQFSVNGQRTNDNYFTVDGVSANFGTNNFAGFNQEASGSLPALNIVGGFTNLVSMDALQEFQIQTSTFAPEFGRTPGAQISMVTKSGANDWHGSAYEYLRNDVFDAADWFVNNLGLKKPPLRYNDFGGTIGGPIRLPGYNGRNRTFFFFSYEGTRFVLPQQPVTTFVPSIDSRNNAPNAYAKAVLNMFPVPTGPANANGGAPFTASYSDPSRGDAYAVRIDHNFNQKISIFGRFNTSPTRANSRFSTNLSENNVLTANTKTLTLGSTQAFTTRLMNDVRVNASSQDGLTQYVFDGLGGGVRPADSAIFPSNVLGVPRRAVIVVYKLSAAGDIAQGSIGTPERNSNRQLNFVDNITYLSGAHQMKFGADYRWISPVIAPGVVVGNYFQAGIPAVYSNTAGLVLGIRQADYATQYKAFSLFGQDTWKLTPRLTLTYGLRWEVNPAPSGKNGKNPLTVANLGDLHRLDFSDLQLAPTGTPIYDTTWGNVAPRLGIAYQLVKAPGHETMVRGGFGVFYDLGQTGFGGIGFPYNYSKSAVNYPVPLTDAFTTFPDPNFTPGPTNRASLTVAVPGYKLPRTYQWNVTLEQSLGSNQKLSASYVGAAGRDLLRQAVITLQPTASATQPWSPNFSTLTVYSNGSFSDYQALQVQFLRRMTSGLQVIANYTWSHATDNGSVDGENQVPNRLVDPNIDHGASTYDVRHNFTMAMVYNLPSPKQEGIARRILGNWSINTLFFTRSALPFTLISDESQTPLGTRYQRRPDVVPGVPQWIYDSSLPGGKRVNPAAFKSFYGPPLQLTPLQGDMRRNSLYGFGAWQDDFGLHRQFSMTEQWKLQFRWEIFNIVNHPNFANPGYGSPFSFYLPPYGNATYFGRSTSMLGRGLGGGGNDGGFNPLFQSGGPRSMQFSLRIQF